MADNYVTKADLDASEGRVLERLEAMNARLAERFEAMDIRAAERDKAMDIRAAERDEAMDIRAAERDEAMETRLLKEFRKWAVRIEAKVKVNETFAVGFNTRLDSVEERLTDLEDRNLQ